MNLTIEQQRVLAIAETMRASGRWNVVFALLPTHLNFEAPEMITNHYGSYMPDVHAITITDADVAIEHVFEVKMRSLIATDIAADQQRILSTWRGERRTRHYTRILIDGIDIMRDRLPLPEAS